ncbi:CRISPR-associated endonuclease Cas3'' [Azomonas macrocytogenes]|uniref:CRISPR-associated endonuclease Cas3-HD n=1 Tax=Azomonas macrocytogenes TaxID=69962 RepID=A0A839T6H6_AZOMA|nr:CRISPR-associated endonuclease Cas3'' [Azomonas macrocytogenes]MBB3103283.1 CRISPR-associated endonuclease Cas3-HD [Azomonas macrocytogenes]
MSVPPSYTAHYRKSDDTWQPLSEHLFGAAAWARIFARKLGMEHLGELLGLLHDLGKYSQEFPAYIKSAIGLLKSRPTRARGLKRRALE